MSLSKKLRDEIRRAEAAQSQPCKQRALMNAFKHNLSGQNLVMQETEVEAYKRMTNAMLTDLNPKTEPERQIAQKIIDSNFRLNRLMAIENNMFNFGITANEKDTPHDDRLEVMVAQTRAWTQHANSFDILGRYEQRLSRQLLKYQEEFERLQTARKQQEKEDAPGSGERMEQTKLNPASFGKIDSGIFPAPETPQHLHAFSAAALPAHTLQETKIT
jgi:hypothetical protein